MKLKERSDVYEFSSVVFGINLSLMRFVAQSLRPRLRLLQRNLSHHSRRVRKSKYRDDSINSVSTWEDIVNQAQFKKAGINGTPNLQK